MDLKKKGETATVGSFKQLKVSLIWTSAVDLDLMAFYQTKDGRSGGVYSDNYSSGNMGDLNVFPFMKLSGDEGVGATGGASREEMLVTKLDDIEKLEIVAVNFTDASEGTNKTFSQYDARVEVMTDSGETHTISLDSSSSGSVATICKISPSFMGLQLSNDSSVCSFDAFKSNVKGAAALQLQSKVTLGAKGDSHTVQIKKKGASDKILINLNWSSPADLDLGCFYELTDGRKSVIDGLQFSKGRGGPQDVVTRQGCYTQPPWIWHMGDDQTGSQMSDGEYILINPKGYSEIKRMTIYAFIYEGVSWLDTKPTVTVNVPGSPEIVVKLGGENNSARFCAIAGLEFEASGGLMSSMIGRGGASVKVTKLISFHQGQHVDCDKTYNWGINWGGPGGK